MILHIHSAFDISTSASNMFLKHTSFPPSHTFPLLIKSLPTQIKIQSVSVGHVCPAGCVLELQVELGINVSH